MQDSGLNPQFESELDAALRRSPDVSVPKHFSQRLLARVPAVPRRPSVWMLPALALAASATLAALGIAAIDLDLTGWMARELTRPPVLVTMLGIESALSLVWMRRVMKALR